MKGSIERTEADKYKISGIVEKINDTTLEITELPIRRWTQDFKEMLEEMTSGTDKVPATIKVCVIDAVYLCLADMVGLRGAPHRHDRLLQNPHDRGEPESRRTGRLREAIQAEQHHVDQ